jgi:hypothetical protein
MLRIFQEGMGINELQRDAAEIKNFRTAATGG